MELTLCSRLVPRGAIALACATGPSPTKARTPGIDAHPPQPYLWNVKPRALWAAIAVAIAIAGVVLYRNTASRDSTRAEHAPSPPSPGAPAAGATATRPLAHVIRLASPEERSAIAERIASTRAARARQAPPPPPSLPGTGPDTTDTRDTRDTSHDLERGSPQLKTALQEAIPFLAECYKTAPITQRRPAVQMTLTGDPDVGTLIDAEQLRDQDGKPLDAELESCLRTTLGSLELPPLDLADPLHVQYSFRLDDD